METKTCKICKKEYPCNRDYFYRASSKNKSYYFNKCITCHKKVSLTWGKKNGDKRNFSLQNLLLLEKKYLFNSNYTDLLLFN